MDSSVLEGGTKATSVSVDSGPSRLRNRHVQNFGTNLINNSYTRYGRRKERVHTGLHRKFGEYWSILDIRSTASAGNRLLNTYSKI